MQQIPVFFTFNNNYVLPASVTFHSLLKHADTQYYYKLYVLYDDISLSNQSKLSKIVERFKENASLEFINVKDFHQNSDWEQIQSKNHYSKDIYNKLIAEIVFPQYNRIMCFDVDVVFAGDISTSYFLYQKEPFYIDGIRTIFRDTEKIWYSADYTIEEKKILSKSICAGYLVFNLDRIRKDKIGEKMRAYYKENLPKLILPEQDVLNICCFPNIGYLPVFYMVAPSYYSLKKNQIDYCDDIENGDIRLGEALNNPVQIHFTGYNKPWNSFFIPKWTVWLQSLADAGLIYEYFKKLPFYLFQRRKQYNLKRFFRKIKKRLSKKVNTI